MIWLQITSAILITLGGIICYIPQFHTLIKNKSSDGISEISLVLMNISMFCLTMNSVIFSWNYTNLIDFLPFIQILSSWMMVLIYYIIYITVKFKSRKSNKKRFMHGLQYLVTYFLFAIFLIALALGEKLDQQQNQFFVNFANALGYSSACINCVVYLPQMYTLYMNKKVGNLSFLTYGLQTPGNAIIILFQAVIYSFPISTWITYAVVFIQQLIVIGMMTYYHFGENKNELEIN